MLVYLSGKMTGLDEHNYPAFNAAAARLRDLGFDVINPAETAGGVTHLSRETFLSIDCGYVAAADAVVVMEPLCWESLGAKLEVILGHSLGKSIFTYDEEHGLGKEVIVDSWDVEFDYGFTALPAVLRKRYGPGGCAA